jgi:hypothetical protein
MISIQLKKKYLNHSKLVGKNLFLLITPLTFSKFRVPIFISMIKINIKKP